MNGVRKKYDEEFKKNAVKLSYVSPKKISELCEDLGISDSMPDHWRQRYTSQGDKTRSATLEEEVKALRLENAELKMERDMLKTNYKRSSSHFRLKGWNCKFFRKHRIERLVP